MKTIIILFILLSQHTLDARTLEVGAGQEFCRLQSAMAAAQPGDTILIRAGTYSGGDYFLRLQGTADNWITIRAADSEEVIFSGGSQAFHLSDPAYVRIEGLIIEGQTGNGVNIDDEGTYDTPAHHIIIERCHWRNMNAAGNNDELKMSGVDDFIVRHCRFENGAAGGSMIDMVGCHRGEFSENHFENAGSNAIQAKGGTKDIVITRNMFINAGQRSINIGGSTGLQFFRPLDANYEASHIYVFANIFRGSMAPIAYVGAVNCEVVNNTIIRPDRWAIRILQETTETGFLPCGNNSFINNIVLFTTAQPAINIGSNTAPESFTFSHNLWYNPDNIQWSGPNTPVTEPGRILGVDPMFRDSSFDLLSNSPAIGAGLTRNEPAIDMYGRPYLSSRSIGAVEGGSSARVKHSADESSLILSPNPVVNVLSINADRSSGRVRIIDASGRVMVDEYITIPAQLSLHSLPSGVYILQYGDESGVIVKQ
jgi:hypothetical protein